MTDTAVQVRMQMAEAWGRLSAITPRYILAGRVTYAMVNAHIEFQGRDRRRIKREVNKAARRAQKALRTNT